MYFYITLLSAILLMSCSGKDAQKDPVPAPQAAALKPTDTCALEKQLIADGLVNIQSVAPDILVDLKYSTIDNFLHTDVYGDLSRAYIQPDVAQKLKTAEMLLEQKDSSLRLMVFDAVRPLSVQQKMWDILKMPIDEKTKYVSNPQEGSIHNYGAAVDLTLYELATGAPVEMPSTYDEATPRAAADFPGGTSRQRWHRALLRRVLEAEGFAVNPTEWWHFDYKDWQRYQIQNRPFEGLLR